MQPRLRPSEKRAVERWRVIEFCRARNAPNFAYGGRGKFVIDAQATPARWPVRSERAGCSADRKLAKESVPEWEFRETGRGSEALSARTSGKELHPCLRR